MFEEHRLPPSSRLIHIGPPKTGTTSIQFALHHVREQLGEHGVRYAGPGSRPKAAVDALAGSSPRRSMAPWDDLVQEVADAGDLRVCISNEKFAAADSAAAARAGAELGGTRAHVVMVARSLEALLPSQWQQRVRRSRLMIPYDEWLEIVLGTEPDGVHFEHFWRLHDLTGQIERWSAATAAERVTVVVSEEADRTFLPHLFEGFLGLPQDMLIAANPRPNHSLDLAGAELLRALDRVAAEEEWPHDFYVSEIKPAVSQRLRAQRPANPVPISLPGWARERVAELNAQRRDLLLATSTRVIGDPDRLTLPGRADERTPGELMLPVELTAGVLGAVIAQVERQQQLAQRRLDRQRRQLIRQRGQDGPASSEGLWTRLVHRVRR